MQSPEPAIALNTDWQEWDGSDGHIKGFVRSDRRIELAKVSIPGFYLLRANLPILAMKEAPGTLALRLAAPQVWKRRRLACDLTNRCVERHWVARI